MKNQLGVYGEKCVSRFLEKRGFKVIEKTITAVMAKLIWLHKKMKH